MRSLLSRSVLVLVAAVHVNTAPPPFGAQIENLVTFGDSYSANYIPGTSWPQYLAAYANLDLYPFAVSGATCNNLTTPRRSFPDVLHNELSNYQNMKASVVLDPATTLYTLWIGTNDVGAGELLTGQATPGASIANVSQCQLDVIQTLYNSGARNFLLQNMIPLDKVSMYSPDSYPNRYWNLGRNTTEWNVFTKELVASGNALSLLLAQTTAPKLQGATIGYFDSHALFTDIITHPALYLNGTAPLNVTGAVSSCVYELNSSTRTCTTASGSAKDSFVWYDELHPSEQANRVVAREIAKAVNGTSAIWIQVFRG